MLLNNEWLIIRSRKKLKFLETNKNDHTTVQNLWDTAKVALRGNHTCLCTKGRNSSNKQPNPTSTRTGGTTTKAAQSN